MVLADRFKLAAALQVGGARCDMGREMRAVRLTHLVAQARRFKLFERVPLHEAMHIVAIAGPDAQQPLVDQPGQRRNVRPADRLCRFPPETAAKHRQTFERPALVRGQQRPRMGEHRPACSGQSEYVLSRSRFRSISVAMARRKRARPQATAP